MSFRKNSALKVENTEELKTNTNNYFWRKAALCALAVITLSTTYDVLNNHRDGECLFTKTFKNVTLGDDELSIGEKHQLKALERGYGIKGVNVDARHHEGLKLEGSKKFDELSDTSIKQLEKHGFKVEKIDYAVATKTETINATVHHDENTGLTYYTLPAGYVLSGSKGTKVTTKTADIVVNSKEMPLEDENSIRKLAKVEEMADGSYRYTYYQCSKDYVLETKTKYVVSMDRELDDAYSIKHLDYILSSEIGENEPDIIYTDYGHIINRGNGEYEFTVYTPVEPNISFEVSGDVVGTGLHK